MTAPNIPNISDILSTALVSGNRPLLLLAVFMVAFLGLQLLAKGLSVLLRIAIALAIVFFVAAYFVYNFTSLVHF